MRVRWIALLTSLIILTACGQKGPLYLPQDANAAASTDYQTEPGPDSKPSTAPGTAAAVEPAVIEQQAIESEDEAKSKHSANAKTKDPA